MAEQLAYPSATVERVRGVGAWQIVDPSLQATEEHEVLNDLDDATYLESDGNWVGGSRPSVLMRVQTLAGKLPLRRPHLAATIFRLRFRYEITGSGTFGVGPLLEVVDYATDHPNVSPVPFPGRRATLIQQTFTAELDYSPGEHELELSVPSYMLKGHEGQFPGCKSIGAFGYLTGDAYDSDIGVRVSVPSIFTGSASFQLKGCWYRVDEVEKGESVQADWIVKRISAGSWQTIDVKGNWAGTPGQVFTTLFDDGSALVTGGLATVDAGRRAGLTKQFSGTAYVEFDPSVYAGAQSNVSAQPNIGGVQIGKTGTSTSRIYWRSGTPSAPGGLVPVDGLVFRTPPVMDGYRDGNDRASMATPTIGYDYDATFVEHGTISFYGIRAWVDTNGVQGFFSDNAGGKPGQVTTLDLHDVQVTGTPKATTGTFHEFTRGLRMGGIRLDMRHVRFGRSSEHSIYTTSPTGDSQVIDCENTFAANFYPKHTGASTQPHNPNSFHQFVMRTNSCTNNGNPPGCTPQGSGTLLVEGCTSRNTSGTDFKCVHTLGSLVNRRCRTFGGANTQRAVQFTVESFGVVGQATTPVLFGVDYSMGSYDNWQPTTCTKHGGSGLANPAQPYPSQVPANGPSMYCFQEVIVEDLQVNGTYGNTLIQIAGADRIIIDRGDNNTGSWPMFGFWEWGWSNNLASWQNGGAGAFDNHHVYFRNMGGDPHAWFGAPTTVQGGQIVSRLAVYGARSNPNQPSGQPNIPYLRQSQLQALGFEGNSAYPAWYQTQKVDTGASGAALGHDWLYPCVGPPNFADPAVYGGYFGNDRRYPNLNTVTPAVERGRDAPVPSIVLGTGGTVNLAPPPLERTRDAPVPVVTLSTELAPAALERMREAPVPAVTLAVSLAPSALERTREAPLPGLGIANTLDFSLYPAILILGVGLPDVLSDVLEAAGEGSTEAASVAGASSGGAG